MKSNLSPRFVLTSIFFFAMMFIAMASANAQTATTLYSFGTSGDGSNPYAGLLRDTAGNLYGTTQSGGAHNFGTVFELVNSSGNYTEKILYSFDANGDGANPVGGLIMDSSGNLYGTTQNAGASYRGTVFELVNSSGTYTETVLYSFTQSGGDGASPLAGLVMDSSGNLYGTTTGGGASGVGTVFELVNSSGIYTEQILHSFVGGSDGSYPGYGSLIMDSSGNLYGTTYQGGASSIGTVFELVNSSGSYSEKVLYSFTGANGDGANPYGGLVMDSSGNLYGTTEDGGAAGNGTVFELVNSSGTYGEKVLLTFTIGNGDGAIPFGGVVMDTSGNLYGATLYGGANYNGMVFELANTSGVYSENVLAAFGSSCGPNGQNPYAGLTIDSLGNLYGTTYQGGAHSAGTVFSVTGLSGPAASTTTTLASSPNPATAGDPAVITATVASLSGNPTGTVIFSEGSVNLGTAPVICGSATVTVADVASLGIGTYSITAQFTPAVPAFSPSAGAFSQTVNEQGVALTNGNNTLNGNQTVDGSVTASTFVGNGSGLTNLMASTLSCTGCIGNMQLGISYAGSASQGGPASNALLFNGLSTNAFQPAGSYATTGTNLFTGAQSITGNLSVTGNSAATGTTTIGPAGTPIVEHLSKVFNPTFTLQNGASCTSGVFTFAGASNGDTVALGVPNQRMIVGDVVYTGWVSAANKITLRVCAFATKPPNFGTGVIRVDVWKH